jgi:glycosyltransferase involved in cell wall biosynthesis
VLDVCICTHNPDPELLSIVLRALANQTLAKSEYRVWAIDNASEPPLAMSDFALLTAAGVNCNLLSAPQLGLIYARNVAIDATDSEWLIFVDDDNELSECYLETVSTIIAKHPEFGCFGGKLLLPSDTNYSRWMQPLLPFLGIKDVGDKELSARVDYWGEWEPPGAGFIIRRSVLEVFQQRLAALPPTFILGRQGQNLLSAEDSAIARGAYDLGLYCAYQPQLKLIHHIKPHRLKFTYLMRLLYGHGRSYVLLERIMGNSVPRIAGWKVTTFILRKIVAKMLEFKSIQQSLCMLAWEFGYLYETRQSQQQKTMTLARDVATN